MTAPFPYPEAALAPSDEPRRRAPDLGLVLVLALSALLSTWALTSNGYANGYYAEAALAASRSWTALLTNAADPSRLASLDKGPLADWMMGLSGRVFGFSSLSLLLPDALCGVAAVALLHDTVRRTLGRRAALLAALMLALSPVSVAVARYDNPDALLALLLVACAWALVRALESGRLRHVVLCGALMGLAFNTKMLEAFLIVPGLAGAYLLAAPGDARRRLVALVAGGATMLAVSAAWFTTMTLIPLGSRPYVEESTHNSWWQLIAGANGLTHIVGYPSGGQGATGPLRLFSTAPIAGQAAWLLPLALVGLLAGLWLGRDAPREGRRRAALVLFGLWLLAGYCVLSFSRGIFHSYYISAIAPPAAALAAAGVVALAERVRTSTSAAATLAGALLGTSALSWALLGNTPGFVPWLRWAVLAGGVVAAIAVVGRLPPAVAIAAAALALLGGPAAYSIATVSFGRTGASPTAGPRSLTPVWDRDPALAHGAFDPALVAYLERHRGGARYVVAAASSDFAAPIGLQTRMPVVTLGGFNGSEPAPTAAQLARLVRSGALRYVLLAIPPGSTAARERESWVASSCTAVAAPGMGAALRGENGAGRGSSAGATLYRC
ncbi:MAG TPA: glycosyltransferase family 39 protein [Solirubrobacteraceae bacterium]|nr:glycosyltransferase family 39 protein [Solirubrobacteraceae bacterium]